MNEDRIKLYASNDEKNKVGNWQGVIIMFQKGKVLLAKGDLMGLIGAEADIEIVDLVKDSNGDIEIHFVSEKEIEDITSVGNFHQIRRHRIR